MQVVRRHIVGQFNRYRRVRGFRFASTTLVAGLESGSHTITLSS